MKAVFVISALNNYKKVNGVSVATNIDNTNAFVTNLKKHAPKINKICYIASSPSNHQKSKSYSDIITESFCMDGFDTKESVIIDYEYKGNIKEEILSSDLVFLLGGHVPSQNAFIKEIGLKEILDDYNGIVVGQSAGGMNMGKVVYIQPECEEEMLDKEFIKIDTGLGLSNYTVMPHMNRAHTDCLLGVTAYEMCLEDSKKITHIGTSDSGYILLDENGACLYGESYLFHEGKCEKIIEHGESISLEKYAHLFKTNDLKNTTKRV